MTPATYRHALARIAELIALDPKPLSLEGRELKKLAAQVETFESMRWPFPAPSAEEMAEFRRQQQHDNPDEP